MHFRPLHDRVVVRRIDAEEKPPAASSFRTPQRKSRRMANAHSAFDLARGDRRELAVRAGAHTKVVAVFPVDEIVAAAPSTLRITRDLVLLETGSGQSRLALELHRPRQFVVGQ